MTGLSGRQQLRTLPNIPALCTYVSQEKGKAESDQLVAGEELERGNPACATEKGVRCH